MIWFDVDATLAEVPICILPLLDDTDLKTRETAIAYNESGMDLVWNFLTTAGALTQTAVTPTTGGGDYDWAHQGDGIYTIGIPASGGASINNDTEGFGWFSGLCDGVLPWASPVYGFRAAAVNNALIDGGDYLQVDMVQLEGADASDTLIGADGDTLEMLSDQLDAIAADLPSKPTKNTALSAFPFLMVDDTDGKTPETGLSITAQRSIDGGAFASCANSATEVGNGIYVINLAASDMNGNTIVLRFTATGARAAIYTIVTQAT